MHRWANSAFSDVAKSRYKALTNAICSQDPAQLKRIPFGQPAGGTQQGTLCQNYSKSWTISPICGKLALMSKIARKRGLAFADAKRILVLHGTNLNTLGIREPAIHGLESFESINERLSSLQRERYPARGLSKATRTICGLGSRGYDLALQFVLQPR
jgi:dehydroquinase class II